MATKVVDYSGTPASNTSLDSVSIEDGWLPSTVNEAVQALMSHLKEMTDGTAAATATTDSITAGTTQTQAGATAAPSPYNRITVCANANDGVKLPSAIANLVVTIKNEGAQVAKVYPNTSDTIDGGSADAADANTLPATTGVRTYLAVDATDWITVTTPDVVGGLASGDVIPADDGAVGAPGLGFADDTDNGFYRIGTNNVGMAIAGAKVMDFKADGSILTPLQPMVVVLSASAQSNMTGDDTVATIVFGTEVTDQNSDFDGTSTFTAPVTGTYTVSVTMVLTGLTSGHTRLISTIPTSNRTYQISRLNPWAAGDQAGVSYYYSGAATVDMDAADTLTFTVRVTNGTKVVDGGNQNIHLGICLAG